MNRESGSDFCHNGSANDNDDNDNNGGSKGDRNGNKAYDKRARFKGTVEDLAEFTFVLPSEPGGKTTSYGKIIQGFKHYFGRTLDNGEDLGAYFGTPSTEPIIARPAEQAPTDQQGRNDTNSLEWILWRDEGKQYSEQVKKLKSNRTTIFSTIFTQCSRGVMAKLEALEDYKGRSDAYDVAWLFQQLRDICNQFKKTEQRHLGLFRAMLAVVKYRQGQHQTTSANYDTLMDLVGVYEGYGGKLHNPATDILTGDEYNQMTEEQLDAAMRDLDLATIIIENSDDARYGNLMKDL